MTHTNPSSPALSEHVYTGHVVYIFGFDVAWELKRESLQTILGQPVAQFKIDLSRRAPRQDFFHSAKMVRMPALERLGPDGPVRVEIDVKLLPVGALSITARVPFRVARLEDLVAFHDLRFSTGETILQEVYRIAEDICRDIQGALVKPVERLSDEEAYTVFCLDTLPQHTGASWSTELWLQQNRRVVAALLTQETDPNELSLQEAEESTQRYLSYYDDDLVVVDWDAALLIDEPGKFAETLYLMELANVQLAELEAYDRMLDEVLMRAYRDLSTRKMFWKGGTIQRALREIRVDFARMSDELQNITKFFGDWHTARVYQAIAGRFHLADWQHTVESKLKTLDELYDILQAEKNNRLMLILELLIVLLFVADIVMLLKNGR